MLRAKLWYFQGQVSLFHYLFVHPVYFIAQNKCVPLAGFRLKVRQQHTTLSLLNCGHDPALLPEFTQQNQNVGLMDPVNGLGGSQGCLGNVAVRGLPGYAAQIQRFGPERIGSPKYRSYIVQAADIVQNQAVWKLVGSFEFTDRDSVQFGKGKFAGRHGKWLV